MPVIRFYRGELGQVVVVPDLCRFVGDYGAVMDDAAAVPNLGFNADTQPVRTELPEQAAKVPFPELSNYDKIPEALFLQKRSHRRASDEVVRVACYALIH